MRLPYAYDDQLIDAVAVRRKRLLAGFMFGIRRTRIVWLDRLSTFIGSPGRAWGWSRGRTR